MKRAGFSVLAGAAMVAAMGPMLAMDFGMREDRPQRYPRYKAPRKRRLPEDVRKGKQFRLKGIRP